MNKRNIIHKVLLELKNKKLLRESPEGDSNELTSTLQECIAEISTLTEQVDDLITTSVDADESDKLNLMKSKLSYLSNSLSGLVAKQTPTNTESNIEQPITEDMGQKPTVNMSVDSVIKDPKVVTQLDQKDVDVNVVDKDGKSLVEEEEINEALLAPKPKQVSVSIGRKTRSGIGFAYQINELLPNLSARTKENLINVSKTLGIKWTDGIIYTIEQSGRWQDRTAKCFCIKGVNKKGVEFLYDRHETSSIGAGQTMLHTKWGSTPVSSVVSVQGGSSVDLEFALKKLYIDAKGNSLKESEQK